MLYRFANVIYWLASAIAIISLMLSGYLYYEHVGRGSVGDGNIAAIGVAAFAVISYGVGWAARYIITGRLK